MQIFYLQVVVNAPLYQHFDYLPPDDFPAEKVKVGLRVQVPFRNKPITGIIIGISAGSSCPKNKIKQAISILDDEPLIDAELMALCQWASGYYHHPLGETLLNAIPTALRQGKALNQAKLKPPHAPTSALSPPHVLNEAQRQAVATILEYRHTYHAFLLDGITGSGKTEVYLALIAALLSEQNKQILVLVPEISLTPQMVARFTDRFSTPIALIHSGLNDTERMRAWWQAKIHHARIVIGTRSAIFTPMPNLALIIVDEEHDPSFKQQEGLRYCARDLAILRASRLKIPIVLGSATPSFESTYHAISQKYTALKLPNRAGAATTPTFHLLDCRHIVMENGLTPTLIAMMKEHLDRQEQVMLFINRRGFAPTLLCPECGWMAHCQHCDARLTLHKNPHVLRCHHCTASHRVPTICENCKLSTLIELGDGTERIEATITQLFPNHALARLDRDTTQRKGALQQILHAIQHGEKQILIGTQMLAKGHHFPNVTLVGVLNADQGLFSVDYRACERTAQMIMQVAGRAGRAEKPGHVFIQTYHPDHPLMQLVLQNDYQQFIAMGLAERQSTTLPPFSFHVLFRAEATKRGISLQFLQQVRAHVKKPAAVFILGPVPAPMEKRAGRFRAQLLLQSVNRKALHQAVKAILNAIEDNRLTRQVRWSVDVDPVDML